MGRTMASLVVLVALTFFLIRQSNPGWLQIIALWLLVFLLGQTGARWVGCLPRSRIMLPRYIAEYLASALAMAACCIWYVTEGTAVLGRYVARSEEHTSELQS